MQPHANKKGDFKNVKQKNKRAAIVFWMGEGCALVSQKKLWFFEYLSYLKYQNAKKL